MFLDAANKVKISQMKANTLEVCYEDFDCLQLFIPFIGIVNIKYD